MLAQLLDTDGDVVSTIEIDESFWLSSAAAIRARVTAQLPGYAVEPSPDASSPERKCAAMGDIGNWLASLPN